MESNATDKPVPREITALLSDERLILRETQRAVTPFGGVAVFVSFLSKIGFVKAIRQHMPICWKSPNHIDPSCTFTAFLVSVTGGSRTVRSRQSARWSIRVQVTSNFRAWRRRNHFGPVVLVVNDEFAPICLA